MNDKYLKIVFSFLLLIFSLSAYSQKECAGQINLYNDKGEKNGFWREQNNYRITELYYQNGIEIILTANQIAKIRGFGMDDNELKINYDKLPIKSRKEMKINGKDLVQEAGVKPGKIMGEILNKLEKEIVFGNIINDKEILIENAKKLLEEKV